MKKSRFSEEQIIGALKKPGEHEGCGPVSQARHLECDVFHSLEEVRESLRLGDRVAIRSGHTVPWVD